MISKWLPFSSQEHQLTWRSRLLLCHVYRASLSDDGTGLWQQEKHKDSPLQCGVPRGGCGPMGTGKRPQRHSGCNSWKHLIWRRRREDTACTWTAVKWVHVPLEGPLECHRSRSIIWMSDKDNGTWQNFKKWNLTHQTVIVIMLANCYMRKHHLVISLFRMSVNSIIIHHGNLVNWLWQLLASHSANGKTAM